MLSVFKRWVWEKRSPDPENAEDVIKKFVFVLFSMHMLPDEIKAVGTFSNLRFALACRSGRTDANWSSDQVNSGEQGSICFEKNSRKLQAGGVGVHLRTQSTSAKHVCTHTNTVMMME